MFSFLKEAVVPHFNFWIYVVIMMIGLWSVIAKNNLVKKLIGLSIFQTAILLLYVSLAVKEGATIPVVESEVLVGAAHSEPPAGDGKKALPRINPDGYANPLPHVLMLTAIVVGVATLGVALSLAQMIYKDFGTLEEDEVLRKIKELHDDV